MYDNTEFKLWYTTNEVLELLGVCDRTLRRLVQDGEFPAPVQTGKSRAINQPAGLRYLGPEVKAYFIRVSQQPRIELRAQARRASEEVVPTAQ